MRKPNYIADLAKDLCADLDTYSVGETINTIEKVLADGFYSLAELVRLNDEDTTKVFDILALYR